MAPPDSLFGPPPEGSPEGTAIESAPLDLPFPGTTLTPARNPTPTTVRPASSSPTTAPAPSPTPTSMASPPPDPAPAPRPPHCTAADLEATLTPEKPSWGPDEPVKLTHALRNRSDHVCGYNASLSFTGYDAAGAPTGLGYNRINGYFFGDLDPLAPGQVVSEPLEWQHYRCEGSPAVCTPLAPGVYRIVVKKHLSEAEATITLA